MPDILKKIGIILITGIIFSVIGILFRKWLTKNGIAQDRIWDIVTFSFFIAVVYQVWFQGLSWKWVAVVELAGVTLGVNRMDFWYAANRGDWWWKKEKMNKDLEK